DREGFPLLSEGTEFVLYDAQQYTHVGMRSQGSVERGRGHLPATPPADEILAADLITPSRMHQLLDLRSGERIPGMAGVEVEREREQLALHAIVRSVPHAGAPESVVTVPAVDRAQRRRLWRGFVAATFSAAVARLKSARLYRWKQSHVIP